MITLPVSYLQKLKINEKIEYPNIKKDLSDEIIAELLQVGMITKQWTGILKEAFTDADNFGINFPLDLDVKVIVCFLLSVYD